MSARASPGLRFASLGLFMLATVFAKGCATDGYYAGGGIYGGAYYGDAWYWNDCCYRPPGGGIGPPPVRPSHPIERPPRPVNPIARPPSRPMPMPMPRPALRR